MCFALLFYFFFQGDLAHIHLNYTVIQSEDSIGTFSISKSKNGKNFSYNLKCNMIFDLSLLGNYKYKQVAKSNYKNNILQNYEMHSNLDGSKYFAKIVQKDTYYQVQINTRALTKNTRIAKQLPRAFLSLYFSEPMMSSSIFSENTGSIEKLIALGDSRYQVEINGNTWTLFYQNNVLTKAQFDGFIDYELRLDNATSH